MNLGLVCPEMTGHLSPSLALARELRGRGHRVSVITAPRVRTKVERAGLEFLPVGAKEDAEGLTDAALARLATLKGAAALFYTGMMLARASEIYLRDLPPILAQHQFDGLVIDQVSPAAAALADRESIPYVVICNALAVHHDPVSPPPPTLWRYRDDLIGRIRNHMTRLLLPPIYNCVTGAWRTGVSPLMLCFAKPLRGLAHVAQQPAFFDFPRQGLPQHFHYTGPWHEPDRDVELPFPWERLNGRPLIYGSLGTLQNRLQHVYAAMAEAVRGLDVQLVIALGSPQGSLDVNAAENVIVVPYAPQLRLLEQARLAITHAGLNTALECLANGVPMICLPVTNDQPGVARRVEWLGAGEILPLRRATPPRLRNLMQQLLSEGSYRASAESCRDQIASLDGTGRAAEIIERALSHRARIDRASSPSAFKG